MKDTRYYFTFGASETHLNYYDLSKDVINTIVDLYNERYYQSVKTLAKLDILRMILDSTKR